jgi:hypothetical protein
MIKEHGGRIIDTAGDGILAEFGSVVNAAECAVAIQRTMGERNAPGSSAMHLDRFESGLIGDMWANAESLELHRIGEARYTLHLVGPGGPITIAIWTTRKSRIRAEYWDGRPPWIALSTTPSSELESLTVEYCGFHFEHVDRDRYIMGFERCEQSWYMAIVAGGYIKTRIVPTPATPTADG